MHVAQESEEVVVEEVSEVVEEVSGLVVLVESGPIPFSGAPFGGILLYVF
jgi:hypothetical protein